MRGFRFREHDAEDVFQEVFARVYARLDSLREDAALRPWIAQLTRRICLDRLADGSREEPAGRSWPRDRGDNRGARRGLCRPGGAGWTSEDCREVLDRFFCRDESYRTIGQALGIPYGTIASRISRCLGKLRERLEGGSESA